MPNWCSNTLRITGPEETISSFRDLLAKNSAASNPDGVISKQVLTFPNRNFDPEDDFMDEPGEALEFRILDDWGVGLICEFDTAWSPPLGAIRHLSGDWPELLFILEYEEPGDGYKGLAKASAGAMEDHHIRF